MSDAVNKPAHYNQGPIECIDAMKIVLTQEEFRGYVKGNVFKYLWREKDKNGNEDIRKGKSYYDRLIELIDESEAEQLATGEVTGEGTGEAKPPDGWRFLEVGEVIRKGDRCFTKHSGSIDCLTSVGEKFNHEAHYPTIRRNRFEVGEKVVAKDSHEIWEVDSLVNGVYQLRKDQIFFGSYPEHLAPYIEETK